MPLWACGHEGKEGHSRLCPHLLGADLEESDYFRVLRGRRLEYDICCSACAQAIENGQTIEWLSMCQACVDALNEDEGNFEEWIGQAGIKERPTSFDATLHEIVLNKGIAPAVAVAPLSPICFVGFWDDQLFLIDEREVAPVCTARMLSEKAHAWARHHLIPRLHASLNGNFVALVNDFGRCGMVFDLQRKCMRRRLSGGNHRQPFSVAFIQKNESTSVVYATNCNHLQISDAHIDEVFVHRSKRARKKGKPSEFVHGTLLVSPEQDWIVDDAYVPHPIGNVVVWNLNNWLSSKNERGAGASRRILCWRDYLWNVPLTWVSNHHLAVWGIGRDDETMLDGARIFDVTTGAETAFFGGEGRLFSIEDDGLHLWDAGTGEWLGIIGGFQPRWQRGDFLIELNENRVRSWNWRMAFREKYKSLRDSSCSL